MCSARGKEYLSQTYFRCDALVPIIDSKYASAPGGCSMRKALLLVALLVFALCPIVASAAEQPAIPTSLDSILSSKAGGAGSVVGQVKRVELGSRNATITLAGGQQVQLDFSALLGKGGGSNYLGWGMLLFGASVATRLLATIARFMRPFRSARRDREYDR